jgi:Arc/MetJ-type ribon-helix-helix transcriptional regulator
MPNIMKTIQVVLGATLLRAADRAAKRARLNRSALIREALREYLKRLTTRELEARDRKGYDERPEVIAEAADWERVAAWPEHSR